MTFFRKHFKKIIMGIIGLYLAGGIMLYFTQERLLFRPEVLPATYKYTFDVPFEEINLPYNKDVDLSAVLFKAKKPKGLVLYFHGNAKNINRYARLMTSFTKNGYDVLIPDYRGFGKSTGKLSEAALYKDALVMYNLARSKFPPEKIVIYGKSIGTGVAAQLASVRDCKRLLLETPYYSLADVAADVAPIYPVSWILKYELPTFKYLKKVTAPVTIFHGTSDKIVAYSSGAKLKQFFKKGDEFVTLPGGQHSGLPKFPLFREKLDSVLNN